MAGEPPPRQDPGPGGEPGSRGHRSGPCHRRGPLAVKRQGLLDQPAVQAELGKLDEQIAAQDEQAGRRPGRHRSLASRLPSRAGNQQIGDATGFDLKPDPLTARTATEFLAALRGYRAWCGSPSWRKMAARAGQTMVHSTMHAAMTGSVLPKLDVVTAIITGCGGTEDDLRVFATAWRHVSSATVSDPAADNGLLPAPVPALWLVPGG